MEIFFTVFVQSQKCCTSSNEQIFIWHNGKYIQLFQITIFFLIVGTNNSYKNSNYKQCTSCLPYL